MQEYDEKDLIDSALNQTYTKNGTAEMIGLTGKYVNAKGSCTFDQRRLIKDGVIYLTTLLKCSVAN